MIKYCQYIYTLLCNYTLVWFIFYFYMRHAFCTGRNVFPLKCVLFCMNVCTMNLNKYSTM